jgi:hypothetical protein
MNDKRIANRSVPEVAVQPRRIIVTRDPITKEFKHEYVPLETTYQEPAMAIDQPYEPYEPEVYDDAPVSLPERGSKKRLRRQRVGHSILLAAALGGTYVGGDYAVTSFNGGQAPNYIEDMTQIPADLGNTYHSIMSAFGVAQSVGKNIDEIKHVIPKGGDK